MACHRQRENETVEIEAFLDSIFGVPTRLSNRGVPLAPGDGLQSVPSIALRDRLKSVPAGRVGSQGTAAAEREGPVKTEFGYHLIEITQRTD